MFFLCSTVHCRFHLFFSLVSLCFLSILSSDVLTFSLTNSLWQFLLKFRFLATLLPQVYHTNSSYLSYHLILHQTLNIYIKLNFSIDENFHILMSIKYLPPFQPYAVFPNPNSIFSEMLPGIRLTNSTLSCGKVGLDASARRQQHQDGISSPWYIFNSWQF